MVYYYLLLRNRKIGTSDPGPRNIHLSLSLFLSLSLQAAPTISWELPDTSHANVSDMSDIPK